MSDIGEYEKAENLLHSILSEINVVFGEKAKESTEIYYALVSILRIHGILQILFFQYRKLCTDLHLDPLIQATDIYYFIYT